MNMIFKAIRRRIAEIIYPEAFNRASEVPMPAVASLDLMRERLLCLVTAYCEYCPRAEATISNLAVGHARLFSRMRSGKGLSPKTYDRVTAWFARNWPADLPWPSDIPRPIPQEKDAA